MEEQDIEQKLFTPEDLVLENDTLGDIKIICYNISNLKAHFDSWLADLKRYKVFFDILVLTETWVKEEELMRYNIPGYSMHAHCRSYNKSGGVIIYISNEFQVQQVSKSFVTAEVVHLKINNDINLIGLYRSHSYSIACFNAELEHFIESISCKKTIMVGDFNINVLDKNGTGVGDYLNILASGGLLNYINEVTRPASGTAIDHFIVSGDLVNNVYMARIDTDLTDHYAIFGMLNIKLSRRNCNSEKKVYNLELILAELYQLDWDGIDTTDINIAFNKYNDMISEIVGKHTICVKAGKTKLVKSKRTKDWMNNELLIMIKNRDKAYKKVKKYPNNPILKVEYLRLRNHVNYKIRVLKKQYYEHKFNEMKGDMRKIWNCINVLAGKEKKLIQPTDYKTDELLTMYRALYCNESVFGNTNSNFTIYDYQMSQTMFIAPVTVSEVYKVVMSLKNVSPGKDEITPLLFKYILPAIMNVLTNLINQSFQEGICPDLIKSAIVVPIYKQGNSNDVKNYRPISMINCVAKVIEKLLQSRINQFMNKYKIMYPLQFGFSAGKSCDDAINYLVNSVTNLINNKKLVAAIFIDLTHAFDTISHRILCKKLASAGLRGTFLDWIKSYLQGRRHYIKLNGKLSEPFKLNMGVPQGSVLGPWLFNFYVNDLQKFINSSHTELLLYADDMVLLVNAANIQELNENLRFSLQALLNWLHGNELILNAEKSKVMCFGNVNSYIGIDTLKVHKSNCPNQTDCICVELQRVKDFKYLGVYIDEKLKWNSHTEYIVNRLRRFLHVFRGWSDFVPGYILRIVYNAWVVSVILYGISVWGATYYTHIKSIDLLLKKLNGFVDISHSKVNYWNVRKFHLYKIVLLMHQLELPRVSHVHNTRYLTDNNLVVPKVSTTMLQNQVFYMGPRLFNLMPGNIKEITNFKKFKYELKQYITNLTNVDIYYKIIE